MIEHTLEVIKTADWVIDLGPEGGNRGGVGAGTPEKIAELKDSYTGQYLKQVLNGNGTADATGVVPAAVTCPLIVMV